MKKKNNYNFLLAFLENSSISKDCIKNFFPLLSLVDFFQCTYHSWLLVQFSESHAALKTTFKSHRRLPESWNKPPKEGYWKDFHN